MLVAAGQLDVGDAVGDRDLDPVGYFLPFLRPRFGGSTIFRRKSSTVL